MNMKRLLSLVAFFATLQASAQQVNPVPDYVFANRMSAGRNTVTDTAAYFSIGPRYGATRGMMPPMVVDTASFSGNKRNGLLIFSVQKNKFLYWDSVGVKWAEMAGTGGSAITGSGVTGYISEFTTATNLDTTRLYHSAGRFAIGSTTTTNGVFNVYGGQSYFDTSLKVGNQTFLADEAKNEVYINTSTDAGNYAIQIVGNTFLNGNGVLVNDFGIGTTLINAKLHAKANTDSNYTIGRFTRANAAETDEHSLFVFADPSNNFVTYRSAGTNIGGHIWENGSSQIAMYNISGEYLINTSTDAGDYKLQINGNIYNTSGGSLAATSGSIGIGTTSPSDKTHILGSPVTIDGSFNSLLRLQNSASPSDGNQSGINFTTNNLGNGNAFIIARQNSGGQGSILFGGYNASNVHGEYMRVTQSSELWINTTTDNGDYKLQVNGNAEIRGNIRTSAPAGGTANDWRLGTVATVSPTSPNRTIEVSIGGTIYYIHAKTTND